MKVSIVHTCCQMRLNACDLSNSMVEQFQCCQAVGPRRTVFDIS